MVLSRRVFATRGVLLVMKTLEDERYVVIGASVSEPHIDEFNVNFLYFYISIYIRGATALLVAVATPRLPRRLIIACHVAQSIANNGDQKEDKTALTP